MSGAYIVRGTRIPAQAVVDNAEDGYTAEQIVAEIYPSLPLEIGEAHHSLCPGAACRAASCLTKAFLPVCAAS